MPLVHWSESAQGEFVFQALTLLRHSFFYYWFPYFSGEHCAVCYLNLAQISDVVFLIVSKTVPTRSHGLHLIPDTWLNLFTANRHQ